MSDLEKKINKVFLDFIIGWNYMSDWAQKFSSKIKKYFLDIQDHLMFYRGKLTRRWDED